MESKIMSFVTDQQTSQPPSVSGKAVIDRLQQKAQIADRRVARQNTAQDYGCQQQPQPNACLREMASLCPMQRGQNDQNGRAIGHRQKPMPASRNSAQKQAQDMPAPGLARP